jgi:hypothetical protein
VSYNEWIDIDVLEDYLDGKLDSKTMHLVEKISLEDPFVAEALAGLSQSPKRTLHLSLLQKQLQERIAQKPVEQKRWRITSQRLSIGAAAAVLFVTVSILFWMKESNHRQQLAQKQTKKVDVDIAPKLAKKKEDIKQDSAKASTLVPPIVTPTVVARGGEKTDGYFARSKTKTIVDKAPVVITEPVAVAMMAKLDTVKALAKTEVAAVSTIMLGEKKEASKPNAPLTVALKGKAEGIHVESNVRSVPYTGIINGRVYTKEDGAPLSGAIVRVAGTNKATTTNNKGEFSIPTDTSSRQNLSVAYVGYTTQQINAKTNQAINVALEANGNTLNEVLIADAPKKSNYASTAAPKLNNIGSMSSNASPVGGWARFDDYLKANNKLYKEKGVQQYITLSFDIRNDGRARNVKVLTGLTKAENQEAIRLIEEGPNWTAQGADRQVKVSIRF